MSIELVMSSNHLILCCPLFLLPSIFPSIRVFSNESVLHIRWPKYWSFSFSISLSNWYSGLISYRIGLISLHSKGLSRVVFSKPQFKSINSFTLRLLYEVQLSHPYMTTEKNIALTIGTFVSNVMSLFFNMLSRFVILASHIWDFFLKNS